MGWITSLWEEKEKTATLPQPVAIPKKSPVNLSHLKLPPFPYQKEGIAFIDSCDGVAFLGDEPGLGKSLQSIGYCSMKKFKTLVVCPASLKYNWENEVHKFTNCSAFVVNSSTGLPKTLPDFTIINYDIIARFVDELSLLPFDCIVCDESHYIMNEKSQRTVAVKQFMNLDHRILMSGTAIKSRPKEFMVQLSMIDPNNEIFTDKEYFNDMFNPEEDLSNLNKMIDPYYIRRIKSEVFPDMSPILFSDINLDLPSKIRSQYNSILNGNDLALQKIQQLRLLLSRSKLNATVEMVNTILNANEKVLILSSNVPIIHELQKIFPNSRSHYGEMSNKEKQQSVNDIQNGSNGNPQILIANTATAVGYTTTSINHVIFVDLPWTPADYSQAYCRSYRIGQTKTVNVYNLLFNDTLEIQMKKLLDKKLVICQEVLNGKVDSNISADIKYELINLLGIS